MSPESSKKGEEMPISLVATIHHQSPSMEKYMIGTKLLQEGKHDQAFLVYRDCVSLDPRIAEAWNNMGSIAKDKKQLPAAIRYFENALAVNSDLD